MKKIREIKYTGKNLNIIAKFGILFPKNIFEDVFLAFLVILFQEDTKAFSMK